jgi:hypothetical protein
MTNEATVTLFRQSVTARDGGRTVHLLDRQMGFVLVPPPPCDAALVEILAEKVSVSREAITQRDRAELEDRGYCRHCLGTLGA